jgi:predicted P-loop ATPase
MADVNTLEPTEVPAPAVVATPVAVTVVPTAAEAAVDAGLAEALENDPPDAPAPHAFLLKDIADAIERVGRSKHLGETKTEFAEQLYPILQAIVEHFGERQDASEAALTEIVEQTDSFVQEDLALLVANALNLGRAMAQVINGFKPGMQLKAEGVAKLQNLAAQYLAAADVAGNAVAEVTIEAGDDGDDGDEEDGDEKEGK